MRSSLALCCAILAGALASFTLSSAVQTEDADQLVSAGSFAGPTVAEGETGPARFVATLYEDFSADEAMACVGFADGYYRAPGNEGYNATLDHVRERLEAAGFGKTEGFELREIATAMRSKAWTPRSAKLELVRASGERDVLHAFSTPDGADRVMLPINAPNADVEGPVAFDLDSLGEGGVLVTSGGLGGRTLRSAKQKGAALVLSSRINDFTVDPRGKSEHLDAILFSSVSASTSLPVGQISPRTYQRLAKLAEAGEVPRLHFEAKVEWSEGPLRTLVATVVGATRPEQAVAIASHVQEPGAGDNASGVGGLAEAACSLARLVQAEKLARPARSLVFFWGDEMRQTAIWLEDTELEVVAGISADMLGQSLAETGAVCLIERTPDPGALDTLPPDAHTPWGAGRVSEKDLVPNGLALIARMALHDVGREVGGWQTSENPWEGGSDHDVFLRNGVPGILIWHFTDFTYHTGLDRMARLDSEELRRTSVGVLATGLAMADLREADLERCFASDALELELRVASAETASRPDVAERWRAWSLGTRDWLRVHCVDFD